MYKCEGCGAVSKPGTPRLTHQVTRPVTRRELDDHDKVVERVVGCRIDHEAAVCPACKARLEGGANLSQLRRESGQAKDAAPVTKTNRPMTLGEPVKTV